MNMFIKKPDISNISRATKCYLIVVNVIKYKISDRGTIFLSPPIHLLSIYLRYIIFSFYYEYASISIYIYLAMLTF